MKIERIDDQTVKCFLSNEELAEYDIGYKDFVLRNEKAREVVQKIIEHAEEEVGYKPPRFAFDLQIMLLPDQGVVLTFSEKDPVEGAEGAQILEYLKEMKQALQKKDVPEKKMEKEVPQKERKKPEEAIFVFGDLKNVMDYAQVLPRNLRVSSSLYTMEGQYYLSVKRGSASYNRYSRACVQALEFGKLYSAEEESLLFLQEHGECLIQQQALRKLQPKG